MKWLAQSRRQATLSYSLLAIGASTASTVSVSMRGELPGSNCSMYNDYWCDYQCYDTYCNSPLQHPVYENLHCEAWAPECDPNPPQGACSEIPGLMVRWWCIYHTVPN